MPKNSVLLPETKELLKKAFDKKLKTTITSNELKQKEGLIKEYFQGTIDYIYETNPRYVVKIDDFIVYISNFELPLFVGDVVKFRNFYHRNGKLYVDTECMIVKRTKPTIKLGEGIIYLVEGTIRDSKFQMNGNIYEIKGLDQDILKKIEGHKVVFQNVRFSQNSFIIDKKTKLYLVKE